MYLVHSYPLAVIFTVVTMFCWGSWANTQKLASRNWRFELFYWDYVIGILLFAILFGFTLGSTGNEGRSFVNDIRQAGSGSIVNAILGGIVFNASNILLVAAMSIAGMAVAFPVGVGIALVLGVLINYMSNPRGMAWLLFAGVALIVVAIVLDALAYKKLSDSNRKVPMKGILFSISAGVLMSLFYFFVAKSMFPDFTKPEAGKLSPYSALLFFAAGVFLSNFIFNTLFMKKPVEGPPVNYSDYFKGGMQSHAMGLLGGIIWNLGMSLNILASGKAGFAISYGLGQGATLIAAFWGVFIWKEFKNATAQTNRLLLVMFLAYFAGLVLIVLAGS